MPNVSQLCCPAAVTYLLVWIMQILFSSSFVSVAARWNWCSCCHFQEQRTWSELGSCRVIRCGPTTRLPYTPVRPANREWALSMRDTGNPPPTATVSDVHPDFTHIFSVSDRHWGSEHRRVVGGTCCLHHQGGDDDGGSTYLWNVGRQLLYTAVHPRRQIWTSALHINPLSNFITLNRVIHALITHRYITIVALVV